MNVPNHAVPAAGVDPCPSAGCFDVARQHKEAYGHRDGIRSRREAAQPAPGRVSRVSCVLPGVVFSCFPATPHHLCRRFFPPKELLEEEHGGL